MSSTIPMNEIIDMAVQAGWHGGEARSSADALKAFAKLVAAKEREACAKVCDDLEFDYWRSCDDQEWTPQDCSKAIRARGGEC